MALALGKSLSEISAMPNSEFLTWQAFYQLEPFGCPVEDQRANFQMQLFYAANSKAGTEIPVFIERWKPEPKESTSQAVNNEIKGFFKAYTALSKSKCKNKRKTRKDKGVKRGRTNQSLNTGDINKE